MRITRCCLLAGGLVLAATGAPGGSEPLHEEDIVRLMVSSTPVPRLVELVRSSAVDFDLSDEMQDELRRAGVPEELLRAMIERQAELHPPPDAPTAAAAEPPGPMLRVRLNPGWKPGKDRPRPLLRVLDAASPRAVERLGLGPHERRFTDLAIVLLCRTPTHVPDHWRAQTPLGRDFGAAPRHRLLALLSGAEKTAAGKIRRSLSKLALLPGERESATELGVLELEIPERIEVEVVTGEAHDLTLGVAVEVGGRLRLVAQDAWNGRVVGEDDLALDAELGSSKLEASALRVRFRKPREPEDQATEAPGK